MVVSVAVSARDGGEGGREAPCAEPSNARDSGPHLPGRSGLTFPGNVSSTQAVFTVLPAAHLLRELIPQNVPHAMLICRPPRETARTIMLDADGHHDDDAASVLGTVQGSPLRSDRAHARGLRALTLPARR